MAAAFISALVAATATAQLSPGPLSAPHAELEGSDHCLKCHSQKKRIAADRCLDCHEILRLQLEQNSGFHSTVTDQGCERCHMEHHGEEFELIYWGEDGETAFDHRQTGFVLVGAHQRLECRSCHKPELIPDPDRLLAQEKQLARTFLGLDGESCESCHPDEHRGQFADRACQSCHGVERWKPIESFDHAATRFPLVGRHASVECGRCHLPEAAGNSGPTDPGFVRFVNIRHSACTDCHQDPHRGRLGTNCQQCHSEAGWKTVSLESFDHSRTRFALVGAHRRVRCEGCHPNGVSQPVARFQKCSDCHFDNHLGQFASRADGGECDRCHDLESFRPARFTLADHQQADYPLQGAHLAIPCNACHRPLTATEAAQMARTAGLPTIRLGGQTVHLYTFSSERCETCHSSPHEPALARFMELRGCETCHAVAGWQQVEFDHERTDYSLVGGHLKPSCRECHHAEEKPQDTDRLAFSDLPTACRSCHADPHRGQFLEASGPPACTTCHSPIGWQQLLFDHNRDSSFILDGVHAKVACSGCHPIDSAGETSFVRYRPLGKECFDCHAGIGKRP